MDKKILKEEIKKTEETIEQLKKIKVEQKDRVDKLLKDCDIGLEMNEFVLGKLKEEKEKI